MLRFVELQAKDFEMYARDLFSILYRNMNEIAPSGSSYEEDFAVWYDYNRKIMESGERKTILFIDESIDCIAGYFQYRLEEHTLWFDEIESLEEYQGKGLIYRPLMKHLLPQLPENISLYKAYIHKNNLRSAAILEKMKAAVVGTTSSGNSLLYCGSLADLKQWLESK